MFNSDYTEFSANVNDLIHALHTVEALENFPNVEFTRDEFYDILRKSGKQSPLELYSFDTLVKRRVIKAVRAEALNESLRNAGNEKIMTKGQFEQLPDEIKVLLFKNSYTFGSDEVPLNAYTRRQEHTYFCRYFYRFDREQFENFKYTLDWAINEAYKRCEKEEFRTQARRKALARLEKVRG